MIASSSVRGEVDAEMIRYSDTFDVDPRALVPASTYVVDGGGGGSQRARGTRRGFIFAGWRYTVARCRLAHRRRPTFFLSQSRIPFAPLLYSSISNESEYDMKR